MGSDSTTLITGGAGFIGSHLSTELLRRGHKVRVLDRLVGQVHGEERPQHLDPAVELHVGDVRDPEAVRKALAGVDEVVHLAARVGVGQSMYEIRDYTDENDVGTAVLLEALGEAPVRKLVVASSMSVYGEGAYVDEQGRPCEAVERTNAQIAAREWEPHGPHGEKLRPVATAETKVPALSSVYAVTKFNQERLCLIYGKAYNVPVVALRFFNVYGPGQALSNPYTGVLAIFASRLLNKRPPLVFEDGNQRRDFVSVYDVARSLALALERDEASGRVVNIGSGESISVLEIGRELARVLQSPLEPELLGKGRAGDIRHCFADIALARELLGFAPEMTLARGIADLAAWLEGQVAIDHVDGAAQELAERGLTV